jgi:hypothetical protein
MALLTDGDPNDTEALRVFETEILQLANVEAIDLCAKLRLATREVSYEAIDILLDRAGFTDPRAATRRFTGVADVVVTPQMKRWHALHTLEIVYRDAYNNQLNDRYRVKWKEYRELAVEAREQTVRFGIGVTSMPIPRAALPVFSFVSSVTPSAVYYVRVSWVSANGIEGSPSAVTTYQTPEGSDLRVSVSGAPAGVVAWNIFIGTSEGALMKQNTAPLAIGNTFVLTGGQIILGQAPGEGQSPETFVIGGRTVRRG